MKTARLFKLLCGASLLFASCSDWTDQYDLDERTPDGWGASIYSWLDDAGNYTNTVRLINDLGYREVLAKTGSKTVFVADDAAYSRFYANNAWGVKSYEDLSLAQKKLLLYGSMMDNSMQLSALSNVEGNPPVEGQAMRRLAFTSEFDTVQVIKPEQMPANPYWKRLRDAGNPVVCMTDNSKVTLLQFVEKLLANRRITNDDYNFLFNNTVNRQPGDASINGVQVEKPNNKCSNGFIHKMAEVVTPLPNMAEIIRQKPQVSQFNRLLERFCAPYPDKTPQDDGSLTMKYNYMYGTQVDTVYQKRFFSRKSQDGIVLNASPDGGSVEMLKFDPGWNAYYAGDGSTGSTALQRDMAVMLVPSDQAMNDYWQNGAGRILRDQYGTWDNVPDDVIADLISNNQLSSFIISVPSKFSSILNDFNDPMGVERADIDSVWLGCNGAVYLTNKVYSPTTFVSVLYPALTNTSMKILDWAAEKCRYNIYLNSLNARYSLFLPNNDALLQYIDPCSYGKTDTQLFRFHWDPSKVAQPDRTPDDRVWASIWNYDTVTGTIGDSIREASFDEIRNRLKDILDNHIVIGDVEDGQEYYQTKGGAIIRVQNTAMGASGMTVEGSYQIDNGTPLQVAKVYDQTKDGNGKVYILDKEPIMTTRNSVYDVLKTQSEFDTFRELLEGSGMMERVHDKRYASPSDNLSTFNTYHYTIYVPSKASLDAMIASGQLPTWTDVENIAATDPTQAAADSLKIVNFLKYHIQDNALIIGGGTDNATHNTALIDDATKRFMQLATTLSATDLTVRDNTGSVAKVVKTPGLYNLMAREYQYNTTAATTASQLQTTSSAVIHLIDKPLKYE